MAFIELFPSPTVGETEPCSTCGHVREPEKRFHEIACCGLPSHRIWWGVLLMEMAYVLAHRWNDDETYAAVKSRQPISEADALVWLERAHAGEIPRRPHVLNEMIECDRWED